ncbi:hypothetical protein C1J03_09770 [Sulfitobacter sp. SK012]|nr:hypothetical protein C1J03_09770 [Sulfitobacter sp. SK012]
MRRPVEATAHFGELPNQLKWIAQKSIKAWHSRKPGQHVDPNHAKLSVYAFDPIPVRVVAFFISDALKNSDHEDR